MGGVCGVEGGTSKKTEGFLGEAKRIEITLIGSQVEVAERICEELREGER